MSGSRSLKLNFDGVESRGLVSIGVHRLQVQECEMKPGKKAPYVSWKLVTKDGGVVYDNTSTSPKALWRLQAILEALGEGKLTSSFTFTPRRYLRKWLTASITHESYNGKMKPVVEAYLPPEDDGGDTGLQGEEFEEPGSEEGTPDKGEPAGDLGDDLDDEIPF